MIMVCARELLKGKNFSVIWMTLFPGRPGFPLLSHFTRLENADANLWPLKKCYGSVKDALAGHDWDRQIEKSKSRVRCHVEHPLHIVKRPFGYLKARYRGLHKNAQRLYILLGCANLLMCILAGRKRPAWG